MTENDRMVQVPVSLIEELRAWAQTARAAKVGGIGNLYSIIRDIDALLALPTPTAEHYPDCPKYPHQAIDCPGDDMDVDHDPSRPAEPPATYQQGYDDGYLAGEHDANNKPPSPTREQIAEVLAEHYAWGRADDEDREAADKVLALLNGADHG